jgi:hypothetical protein
LRSVEHKAVARLCNQLTSIASLFPSQLSPQAVIPNCSASSSSAPGTSSTSCLLQQNFCPIPQQIQVSVAPVMAKARSRKHSSVQTCLLKLAGWLGLTVVFNAWIASTNLTQRILNVSDKKEADDLLRHWREQKQGELKFVGMTVCSRNYRARIETLTAVERSRSRLSRRLPLVGSRARWTSGDTRTLVFCSADGGSIHHYGYTAVQCPTASLMSQ